MIVLGCVRWPSRGAHDAARRPGVPEVLSVYSPRFIIEKCLAGLSARIEHDG